MKKTLLLILLLVVSFSGINTYAQTEESSKMLPGGDNYFNTDNFVVENNILKNVYPIRVKPNTGYYFVYYMGPRNDITLLDELLADGISSRADYYISLDSFSESDSVNMLRDNPPGSSAYFYFRTDIDDDFVNRLYFPISKKLQDKKDEWKYHFYMMEDKIDVQYVDMVGEYINPLPSNDVIYDQAIKEGIYYVSYDSIPSAEEIKKLLMATDNVDGDISDEIYLESSLYEGNKEPVGEYRMVYAVKDNAGNKTTFTIILRVMDITSPKVIGPQSLVVNIGNNNAEYYMSLLTVRDNFDDNPTLRVKSSNLDSQIPGTYTLVFEAIDQSNNITEFTMFVRVHDNYAPVITASSIILDVDVANSLTLEQIKKIILDRTKADSDSLRIVYNDYLSNENIPGEYRIEYIYAINDEIKNESLKIIVTGANKKETIRIEMYIGICIASCIVIGGGIWFFTRKLRKKKIRY